MKKICPICQSEFECLHDENIAACHCASVPLSVDHLKYLKEHYSGCLCHACLVEIAKREISES